MAVAEAGANIKNLEVVTMAGNKDVYESALSGRYASEEMKYLFSPNKKFRTWRQLWVALAKAERELGLDISEEQIKEMIANVNDINYDAAERWEREIKHDVMAHVHAYGEQAKSAAGIIHLGATSCYVTDNTDILLIREGLQLVKQKLLGVIQNLAKFANIYKDMPTLGYTHFQAATPTTVGKRATLWLQNFLEDLRWLEFVQENLKLLGCRGATGSSETFMKLFNGDEEKVKSLDVLILNNMMAMAGTWAYDSAPTIYEVYPVSGQTYPRNLDIQVMSVLGAIMASASKMTTDIRLLQHEKELEEPFGKNQVGSSAMAFKRNPMRCERICSLAREVQALVSNAYNTANTQWLERTLDDSAVRRAMIPEGFLGTDAVLKICANVTDGLVVYPEMIKKHLEAELPFMVTEDIIMKCVEKGADRQDVHESVREFSMEAVENVKKEGGENDLIERLMTNARAWVKVSENESQMIRINKLISEEEMQALLDPAKLTGRCAGQVEDYLNGEVWPTLKRYKPLLELGFDAEMKV